MSLSYTARKLMEDEERARIVREVTEDTQNFLENLPRNGYKEGWSEDKWEEEMEKHPLFMSKIPESQDISPLVEAFQSLKYDPEYNDPIELAKAHKDDGNEQFKQEKYEFAVAAYSEGLKIKAEDDELNAQLYSNRAAAFYHMRNYKNSLEDAIAAKALKPCYSKAFHRGALCYLKMKKYEDCISWCEEGLKLKNDDQLIGFIKEAKDQIEKQKLLQREAEAEQSFILRLTKAIKDRRINIAKNALTSESLVCCYNGISSKVSMTDEGEIVWPVVFNYPQHYTSDFIEHFNENSSFYDQFCVMFEDHPEWDTEKQYTPDNLKVYFCDKNEVIVPVNPKETLKMAMCHKRFEVTSGVLCFYITCSEFDKTYRYHNHVADD